MRVSGAAPPAVHSQQSSPFASLFGQRWCHQASLLPFVQSRMHIDHPFMEVDALPWGNIKEHSLQALVV